MHPTTARPHRASSLAPQLHTVSPYPSLVGPSPRAPFASPPLGPTETRIHALATPSPISIQLAHDAQGYSRIPELIAIISSGALLRVDGPTDDTPLPTRRSVPNHASASTYANEIREQLAAEIAAGTTFNIGPTLPREWRLAKSGVWPCPIGAVPKSSSTPENTSVRIIVDASHGGSMSLNDRITTSTAPPDQAPYLSSQSIAATLLAAGPTALYSLTDVKSAFQNIALHPSQYRFSVICFEGNWHIQTRVGFGFASSPDLFDTAMGAFDFIQRAKQRPILRIVDDILNFDLPATAKANTDSLRADMAHYGLPRAVAKDVNQQSSIKFNGLLWDAPSLSVSIPPTRLLSIQACISAASLARPSLFTIEQVTGKLMSIVCVIIDGKAHLQHLYRAINLTTIKFGHRASPSAVLSRGAREELRWWRQRLQNFQPRPMAALAADNLPLADSINIWTDACGTGLGVFLPESGAWTFLRVPPKFQIAPSRHADDPASSGSTLIEVAAVLLAISTFQTKCANSNVHIHCDNSGAVAVFQRHHSPSPRIGAMLTAAVDICTARRIALRVSWVPGVSNTVADPISRSNWRAFHARAPRANRLPTPASSSPFDILS